MGVPSFFSLAGINSEGYQERESFELEFNAHMLSLGNSSLRAILTIFLIANKMTSKQRTLRGKMLDGFPSFPSMRLAHRLMSLPEREARLGEE